MTVVARDTHEVVKELKAAGFTDAPAKAVTRVVRRAQDVDLSELATKSDLRTEVATVSSSFQIAFVETKADLLKWVNGAIGVQRVVILGALLTLARAVPR